MSSFGDTAKTDMQESLDRVAIDWYGKETYNMNADEKVKFLRDLFVVLNYMFGEW